MSPSSATFRLARASQERRSRLLYWFCVTKALARLSWLSIAFEELYRERPLLGQALHGGSLSTSLDRTSKATRRHSIQNTPEPRCANWNHARQRILNSLPYASLGNCFYCVGRQQCHTSAGENAHEHLIFFIAANTQNQPDCQLRLACSKLLRGRLEDV